MRWSSRSSLPETRSTGIWVGLTVCMPFHGGRHVFKEHLVLLSDMEHISIKLDSAIAKQIERALGEFNYTTMSEFIRDAVRGKLKELDEERRKKKAWDALFAARGALKGQGKAKTDEEWYKFREEASKGIMKHYEKKFGINLQ